MLTSIAPEKLRHVAALLQRHGRWLELVYLPAYSLELQPLDRLFRILRGRMTRNHHRTTLDALEAHAEEVLHALTCGPFEHSTSSGSPIVQAARRHAA